MQALWHFKQRDLASLSQFVTNGRLGVCWGRRGVQHIRSTQSPLVGPYNQLPGPPDWGVSQSAEWGRDTLEEGEQWKREWWRGGGGGGSRLSI